jgi:aspartate aminotransferase
MMKALSELPNVRCRTPEGAFYAFPDFSKTLGMKWNDKIVQTDEDLAFFLLDRAHVAVVPGGAFGAPGYLRLSYATSEARIVEGVARIKKAIDEASR